MPTPPRASRSTFASLVVLTTASFGLVTAAPLPALADDAACIAASEKALALRKQGKLHAAIGQLAVCAAAACPDEVKADCAQRVEAVRSEMPSLILAAKDGAGNDLSAATVTMDGAPLAGALDGQAITLDPGEHTFTFTVAGQPPLEKKLVLRQGEKDRHESVVLGPAVITTAPPLTPLSPPSPPPSSWSTGKTLAIVSAGVGVVGVGLGVVFGAYAKSSQSREKTDCSVTGCGSYAQGLEDYRTAQKDATGATIAYVAGGALVAAGVVLWVTAPKKAGTPPASASTMGSQATPNPGLLRRPYDLRLSPALVGTGRGLALGVDL
jgi:hypothetical protein